MHQQSLRLIIRQKFQNETLPYNSIPRVWGRPANGETCDGCGGIITEDEMRLEGISLAPRRKALQLHVECFHLWEQERHAVMAPRTRAPAGS